ncbi:rhomboid family intramembrane serine protease [uncultured Muribaculum sp.]|uniref:rhomboid family intramembrane serine protease n=1 Tax=uncultured Muribaculum sp. TaxID=1918613 RepID=UPI00258EC7DA|nr:rhomboid family intramembrane serine protease [uncultured Muribaculum sp.]
MADIIRTLRGKWKYGSLLYRIIFINIAVFILLHAFSLVSGLINSTLAQAMLSKIGLPSSLWQLLMQPWSIITYMFTQYDLFHILFNMVWLYWFGEIFLITDTPKRLTALYFYGGISGGVLFMLAYAVLPVFEHQTGFLIGASASVIAIVAASAILHPDYKVPLFFIGEVPVKWIAIITIAIDFISIGGNNGGGHISHIGGALAGVAYAIAQRRGTDITKPFNRAMDKICNIFGTTDPGNSKKHYQKPAMSVNNTLDSLLDKIRRSGYNSLTIDEKKRLMELSNELHRRHHKDNV